MKLYKNEFSIKSMAEVLKVSRSGFYKFLKKKEEVLSDHSIYLLSEIQRIWRRSKRTYGLLRIMDKVKEIDQNIGARKIRKMMNFLEIKGKQEKKFRISTTDSNHSGRVAPDLLKRKFDVLQPNSVWVSDVTYIRSFKGWLYLCVIIDLYSRKVVGWSISENNDSNLVCDSIRLAISKRNPGKGLIFHSDRGTNYCSRETRLLLIQNGIRRSNSRKGNCWDNAVAESFFGSLKREMEYSIFGSKEEGENILFEHIEIFYNRQRSHSKLGYKSPEEFEKLAA